MRAVSSNSDTSLILFNNKVKVKACWLSSVLFSSSHHPIVDSTPAVLLLLALEFRKSVAGSLSSVHRHKNEAEKGANLHLSSPPSLFNHGILPPSIGRPSAQQSCLKPTQSPLNFPFLPRKTHLLSILSQNFLTRNSFRGRPSIRLSSFQSRKLPSCVDLFPMFS